MSRRAELNPCYAQGWQCLPSPRALLGQSCHPQSFGAIVIPPETRDPVVAKVEDGRERLIDRGAAALAASLHPAQHKHPIAEIAKRGIRSSGKLIKMVDHAQGLQGQYGAHDRLVSAASGYLAE